MGRSDPSGEQVGVEGRMWLELAGFGPWPQEVGFGGAAGFTVGAVLGSGWLIVGLGLVGLACGWLIGVRRPGVPFTMVSVPARAVEPGCWMAARGRRLVQVVGVEEDLATLRYKVVGEDGSAQWSSRRGTVALARLARPLEGQ